MVFQSQLSRQATINLCIALIPDIIIAAAISWYFEGGFIEFLLAFVGLIVLGTTLWVLHGIVEWIVYALYRRRTIQRHMYRYLVENHYPPPREYETSASDYFVSVMNNKNLDVEMRIKAAVEVGTFSAFSGSLAWQHLLRLSLATEGAIKEYQVWLAERAFSTPDDR